MAKKKSAFTTRLREALEKKGITQAELAEEAGVSRASVSAYLAGKTTSPKPEHCLALAHALEVSIEWLVLGKSGKAFVRPPLDINLLKGIITGVEKELKQHSIRLGPERYARLLAVLYEHCLCSKAKTVAANDIRRFASLMRPSGARN